MAKLLKKVLALCYRRGFLLKRSGAMGTIREFDYGPLGTELKRNLLNEWWHTTVTLSGNVHPIDSSIVACSPMEQMETSSFCLSRAEENVNKNENTEFLRSTICGTAQLENYLKVLGQQLPFGIAECGRVFLQSSLGLLPLRQQECEHMCVQFFCQPQEDKQWYSHWQKTRLRWWKRLAANPESFSLVETPPSDLPEHTLQESYIKYNFPWGPAVVESIANRGNEELQSMAGEGQSHLKFAKGVNGKTYPHIISLSANVDCGLLAYMCDAYNKTMRPYGTEQELRQSIVLKLHSSLSPCKVAILPASEDHKLYMYCRMLTEELRLVGIVTRLSNIGSFAYRLALLAHLAISDAFHMQDEIGTPYRIVVDEKTIETGIVSLQDRDTTAMEDMAGRDALHSLQRMLSTARLNIHTPNSYLLQR